jgi:hypothetical protein
MNNKIRMMLMTFLISYSASKAQNIEKMNKSELREHILTLTTKVDSLKNEILNLSDSKNKISLNFSLLEQKNSVNEVEISRLNKLIIENKNEKIKLASENEIAISKLNKTILILKDTIANISAYPNAISTSTTNIGNDFLNKYYFNQIPLPNNSFNLVLSKMIYGTLKIINNNYYEDDDKDDKGGVASLPELLDFNEFTCWAVKPNIGLRKGTEFKDYVISKNNGYLNSQFPKIEILKNKLFTIKYKDGSEESFLFNVKQTKLDDNNNQRKILQIELANEAVKEDGSNNPAKDMVWRFFAIENECYLALSFKQLNRIKLNLYNPEEGLDVYSLNDQGIKKNEGKWRFNSYYYNYTTTGEGIYLSRNKDAFMETSNFLNPEEIIYLFKLK